MSYLWKKIDSFDWQLAGKYRLVLLILEVTLGFAGFVVWEVVRMFCLDTFGWMLCFIGYPALLSFVIVMIYSDRHPFHRGSSV